MPTACLAFILLMFGSLHVRDAIAAPTGAELLRACESSLASGFKGNNGMMCEWYVTPCDCQLTMRPDIPRVCLPESVSTVALARKVVDGLSANPVLQTLDADLAAGLILSQYYSCDEDSNGGYQ